jgi:hypothetical protein
MNNSDDPDGIRTRVAALKGPCPRPLDDGALCGETKTVQCPGGGTICRCCGHRQRFQPRIPSHFMLHYYKFRQDLFAPRPAREIYVKRSKGRGWPEECPPFRAANAFGFDLLANFDLTFVQKRGRWSVVRDIVIVSDFDYSANEESQGNPLTQQYAWFWEKAQKLPHVISDNVYAQINNQVKVSSFLFLKTDPNEMLLMTEVPNQWRPFRALSAVVETDWYPASYPWHVILELDRREKRIRIKKGEPICRVIPVRRETYFSGEMSQSDFGDFFERGQKWLTIHGKPASEGQMDITRTYVRQKIKPKFVVRV